MYFWEADSESDSVITEPMVKVQNRMVIKERITNGQCHCDLTARYRPTMKASSIGRGSPRPTVAAYPCELSLLTNGSARMAITASTRKAKQQLARSRYRRVVGGTVI